MKYLKLFILSFFLVCGAQKKIYSDNLNKTSNTKTAKAKRNIIRNTKQKQNKIKATTTKSPTSTSVYSISKRTINLKSPMCKYAKQNDVIALKKSLLASNYDESEVNTICDYGESLLIIAVKNNNYITAKFLIEKGADLNIQNDAGVSALHIMAKIDTKEIDRMFSLFIYNKNINLNIQDNEGYTPLMRAINYEKVSMIEKMMEFKVDLNIKNNYGENALELAKKNLEGKKTEEEKAISQHIIDIIQR